MNLKFFFKSALCQRLRSRFRFINDFKLYSTLTPVNFRTMNEKRIEQSLRKINHIKRAQKAKTSSYSSRVSLQILGAGVRGSPSCLYVNSDHVKYLFNCGEGTQRLAHEHHSKLSRLEHIFFTAPTWKNMGGLPGMILTVQESGLPNINLHGPQGIKNIYEAVRRFIHLSNLNITEAKCDEDDVYEDSCMSVRYVHLKKSTVDPEPEPSPEIIYYDDTNYYEHEMNENRKRCFKQNQPQLKEKVFKKEPSQFFGLKITNCVAYICKITEKVGQLDIDKCLSSGVIPGPLLGKLKNGEDVTLEDGKVIKSSDVVTPSSPGPIFIVLECPDEDYLDSLVNHKKFNDYQIRGLYEDKVEYVIHFSPENIMRNPRYIEWMNKFSPNVQHVIINSNNKCISSEGIHKIQHKLYLLHPEIFPMLPESKINEEDPKEMENSNEIFGDLKIHRAKVLNSIQLRPPTGMEETVVTPDRTKNVDEVMQTNGFLDTLAELQTEINAKSEYIKNSPEFAKILMLGTGSSVPNKVRNTSGILLRIEEDTSILLDCGEGTAGQIVRFYGPKAGDIFSSIKAIFVSHLHADHHVGLIGIIQERQKVTNEPFFLLAPKPIELYLRIYHKIFESIESSFILVPNGGLLTRSRNVISDDARMELCDKLKLQELQTEKVLHCSFAFCIGLRLQNGQKIVYSGDTKPCCGVRFLGQNCDLLIHEATMEDGMELDALKKRHSTISQAINEGKKMNAKFILLTHFSQRFCKMPRLPENMNDTDFNNVGIAFDNMHFNLAEMSLLPLFYPSLRLIFSEFHSLLEERSLREAHRKIEKLRNIT